MNEAFSEFIENHPASGGMETTQQLQSSRNSSALVPVADSASKYVPSSSQREVLEYMREVAESNATISDPLSKASLDINKQCVNVSVQGSDAHKVMLGTIRMHVSRVVPTYTPKQFDNRLTLGLTIFSFQWRSVRTRVEGSRACTFRTSQKVIANPSCGAPRCA